MIRIIHFHIIGISLIFPFNQCLILIPLYYISEDTEINQTDQIQYLYISHSSWPSKIELLDKKFLDVAHPPVFCHLAQYF
jgi:hypothetical protein